MIALIDYGIGNLRSVQKALEAVGAQVCLTCDPQQILQAEKVILPGVGAFGDGMRGLQGRGLLPVLEQVRARQAPLLGICLGMQLLFDSSAEAPGVPGLGFLPGGVLRLSAQTLKIPQTGWNQIRAAYPAPLLAHVPEGAYAYFNHSYYCQPADSDDVLATTEYGCVYASMIAHGSLYGVQFHPEKSQAVGLCILRNFVELV